MSQTELEFEVENGNLAQLMKLSAGIKVTISNLSRSLVPGPGDGHKSGHSICQTNYIFSWSSLPRILQSRSSLIWLLRMWTLLFLHVVSFLDQSWLRSLMKQPIRGLSDRLNVVSDISISLDWDWTKSANWDINLRFKIWSRDLISSSLILGTLTTNETPRFS